MHIVLVEPEIPGNTGNIARLCAATGCHLHLVRPLGFSVEDKYLKRAGLDYWHLVKIKERDSYEDFLKGNPDGNFYYATTKCKNRYTDVKYKENDFIIFGPESRGLPKEILEANPDKCITIPMIEMGRSLNLSNSAAIILYEALRQTDFNFGE